MGKDRKLAWEVIIIGTMFVNYELVKLIIGLHHPLDGVTNPKYELCFIQLSNFFQREEGTSF